MDQMAVMEKQIRAMQSQLSTMRKEHDREMKRVHEQLAHQRQDEEANPYGKRDAYVGRPNPQFAYPSTASNGVSVHLHQAGDGRPPSDRGTVSSWADFQRASNEDEEINVGGMKIGFPHGRPTIQSADGAYALSIGLAFHEDFGGFLGTTAKPGEQKGNFNSFTANTRRMRIPISFRYKNWVANVTPDFGQSNNDGLVGLYEANLNYAGLKDSVLTVGYFQPRVTEEDSESSNDFFMMERPGITDIVRSIAAGDARFSVGGLHYAKRWWIAGYFTGQEWGNRNTTGYYSSVGNSVSDSQTGGTLRIVGRPVATKNFDVHMGVSSIASFKPAQSTGGRTFTLSQRPEVNLGETTLLSTGAIGNVSQVWAAGPELGFRWNRLLVKGEYYYIGVNRASGNGGEHLPSLGFQGWYGALAYTVFGEPRKYNIKEGAFSAPGVKDTQEFDPAHNQWGALEITGRYSVSDMNSRLGYKDGVRGGQQTVWAGGFNWYPNRHFRFMVDYNHFIVSRTSAATNIFGRTGNSIAARIQAAF